MCYRHHFHGRDFSKVTFCKWLSKETFICKKKEVQSNSKSQFGEAFRRMLIKELLELLELLLE